MLSWRHIPVAPPKAADSGRPSQSDAPCGHGSTNDMLAGRRVRHHRHYAESLNPRRSSTDSIPWLGPTNWLNQRQRPQHLSQAVGVRFVSDAPGRAWDRFVGARRQPGASLPTLRRHQPPIGAGADRLPLSDLVLARRREMGDQYGSTRDADPARREIYRFRQNA
jgi:hypothetical protein